MNEDGKTAMILVGVDGSKESAHALAWAIDEAERSNASVEVVTMWQFPALGLERPSTGRNLHEQALAIAQRTLEVVLDAPTNEGHEPPSPPPVHVTAFLSDPAERLIAMSADADLLVVGRRGGGGFKSSLMGSVSRKVASHATCPVVIVPLPAAGSEAEHSMSERFGAEHPKLAGAIDGISQHLSGLGI